MVHRHAPAKAVFTLEIALVRPLQTTAKLQPQQHLWRGGLPPSPQFLHPIQLVVCPCIILPLTFFSPSPTTV